MHTFVPISQIEITDRQRKEITPKELIELKRSILSKGLLHAPVLSYPGPLYRLVAGERRLRAMVELHEEGLTFTYNNEQVPADHIPFTLIGDLVPADLQEAELEENILRMPLTWMEEAAAKAKIHELRVTKAEAAGEKKPTIKSTAEYIEAKKGTPPEETAKVVENRRRELTEAILVNKHKDDPAVKAAKNLSQAYAAVLAKQENFFKAILAEKSGAQNTNLTLLKGDCLEILPTLEPGTFDIIFTDPPYGIGADTMKHDSKHFYDDSPENALRVCEAIIARGFELTKPKAALFMWCDVEHYIHLRNYAARQGWTPWRAPLIWHKGDQGHAPWGRAGFIRTYEMLLFVVKGQRELFVSGGPDVVLRKPVANATRQHAAEKPAAIIQYFLEKAALQGDKVLDPCCGTGAIFEAGNNLHLQVTGIEISPEYHTAAAARIGDLVNGKDNDQDLGEAKADDLEADEYGTADVEGLENL